MLSYNGIKIKYSHEEINDQQIGHKELKFSQWRNIASGVPQEYILIDLVLSDQESGTR